MAYSSSTLRALVLLALGLLVLGTLTVLAGLLVPPVVKTKLEAGIRENTVWQPYSPRDVDVRYRGGDDPSLPPMYFRAWVFNVSNLGDVRLGAKPILEQVGPFVYQKKRQKLDVLWDSAGRVHFKEWFYYQPLPELTRADPGANVTTLNLALLGVLAQVHASAGDRWKPFADLLVKMIAEQAANDTSLHGVFATRTVQQLLWGYEDPLLVSLQQLLPPGLIPRTNVALVVNMSSAEEARRQGVSVVNTGAFDPGDTWNYEVDRGSVEVTSWPCPEPVRGSDALQFEPGLTPDTPLRVWVGDLFRSLPLTYLGERELHGLKLNRYTLDLNASSVDPCYNQGVAGLFNITTPEMVGPTGSPDAPGPPLYVSMPMFCGGDPALQQGVEGLHQCDPKHHLVYVDVEPITGITMSARQRLMVSSKAGELGDTLDPAVDGATVIPLFWADLASDVPPLQAALFREQVYSARWVVQRLTWWCWVVGGVLLLAGVVVAVLLVELAADPSKWPQDVPNQLLGDDGRLQGAAGDEEEAAAEAAAETQPLLFGSGAGGGRGREGA